MRFSDIFSLFNSGAQEQEVKICDEIDKLGKELAGLLHTDDLYLFALSYNRQESQKIISEFLEGPSFTNFKKKWQDNPGIQWMDDTAEAREFPTGKVCLQSKSDEADMPISMRIIYKAVSNIGSSNFFNLDLSFIETAAEAIQKNNLTYLRKNCLEVINQEISSIFEELKTASAELRIALISDFNHKWQNKFFMALTVGAQNEKSTLLVKEKYNCISFTRVSKEFTPELTAENTVAAILQQIIDEPLQTPPQTPEAKTATPLPSPLSAKLFTDPFKDGFNRNHFFALAAAGTMAVLSVKAYRTMTKP
jgi:hypothetical protein